MTQEFIFQNLITLFILAQFISCGNSKNENDYNKNKNIIDVKTIIEKSEIEIEKILGKAEIAEKKSQIGIPCETKFYQKNKFEIVFCEGKSYMITIRNISNCDFNSENIKLLGLSPKPSVFESTSSIGWENIENINSISFINNGENKIDLIHIQAFIK